MAGGYKICLNLYSGWIIVYIIPSNIKAFGCIKNVQNFRKTLELGSVNFNTFQDSKNFVGQVGRIWF